jgi:hypothetical protein
MPRRCGGIVAGACLVLIGCPLARAADSLKFLPNDCDTVLSLDFKQCVEAPAVRKYAPELAARYGLEVLKAFGQSHDVAQTVADKEQEAIEAFLKNGDRLLRDLDLLKRHLTRITCAGQFHGPGAVKRLLLLECDLDAKRLFALIEVVKALEKDRITIHKQPRTPAYTIKVQGEPDWHVALVEKGLVAASPILEYVEEAVAKATGAKELSLSKSLQAQLGKVDSKATGWIASTLPDKDRSLRGNLMVADDLRAELIVTAKDAKDATTVVEEIRQERQRATVLLAALILLHKEFAPLGELVSGIEPMVSDDSVSLKLRIDSKTLDKIVAKE